MPKLLPACLPSILRIRTSRPIVRRQRPDSAGMRASGKVKASISLAPLSLCIATTTQALVFFSQTSFQCLEDFAAPKIRGDLFQVRPPSDGFEAARVSSLRRSIPSQGVVPYVGRGALVPGRNAFTACRPSHARRARECFVGRCIHGLAVPARPALSSRPTVALPCRSWERVVRECARGQQRNPAPNANQHSGSGRTDTSE